MAEAEAGTFAALLVSEPWHMSPEDVCDVTMHSKLLRDAGVAVVTCQRGELKFDNLGSFLTAVVDRCRPGAESTLLADRVVSGERPAHHTTMLAHEYARQAPAWEDALPRRAEESALMQKLGLTLAQAQPAPVQEEADRADGEGELEAEAA